MMAQVPSSIQPNNKRVKVYELRNDDWFDSGTGFCTATYVFNEATRAEEPRVLVQSEQEPDCTILNTKIYVAEGFRKQSETLIIWTEPTTTLDMALSFQESDGCAMIWKFVDHVQQQLQNVPGSYNTLSDDIAADHFNSPISLPNPSLGSLQEIEVQMRGLQNTDHGRDTLTKYVLSEEYIQKLIPLVEMAEDMEDLASLHRLCNIMKTLILLNDTTVIELIVTDNVIMGVVGALEYDPDFPNHKANHRQWLAKDGRYREVVRINDDTRKKIHSTYRLQYLKDVVLARILDDPTFSVLNSLIFFNQVDIVQNLQSNPLFLKELFGIFGSQELDQKRKKEAVLFIQQCCAIAKNLQPNSRQQLYDNFLNHGLLLVVNFALRHTESSVRVGASEVLVSMIDHDPAMIRQTIYRQMSEKQIPLTDYLIDLFLVESDLGVRAQIADAIKILFDPVANGFSDSSSKPYSDNAIRLRLSDSQQRDFVKYFYEESATKLFKPLVDLKDRNDTNFSVQEVSLFIYLMEILGFIIRQHTYPSRLFVLSQNLGQHISKLFKSSEKYLRLNALKFFRNLIGLQDESYNQHIIQGKLLEPILDFIIESKSRDNLLNSAALELFNYIGREKIRSLTDHLVVNYEEKMMKITGVDVFIYLIRMHNTSPGYKIISADIEDETNLRSRHGLSGRWESSVKDLDAQEEEYFNTSDDDNEQSKLDSSVQEVTNIISPLTKPLVDYLSDEDEIMGDCDVSRETSEYADENKPQSLLSGTPISPSKNSTFNSPTLSPIVPGKLSEKRRREADEVDELDKISQVGKRRNSMSSSAVNGVFRKKKKISGASNADSPKKKISISISPASKKTVESSPDSDASHGTTAVQTSFAVNEKCDS